MAKRSRYSHRIGQTNNALYGETKFGQGLYKGFHAKDQKVAATREGAGLYALGIDPRDPQAAAKAQAYIDTNKDKVGWLSKSTWGRNQAPGYATLKSQYPDLPADKLLDILFRQAMSASALPPRSFDPMTILDPLIEVGLGFVPGVGPALSAVYGAGRGASEGGLLGGITGGLGGYLAGAGGANLASGIKSAGGVGNYLSNIGSSAYNSLTNLPSTLGNIGKDFSNYYQYGPELTNLNAALGSSAPWAAGGMAAGASGAMRAAASGGNFLNNLLSGGSAASSVGTLGSSAVGGGGMDWGDLLKFAVDVGVPIYSAGKTEKALSSGAAAQTAAANRAIDLQRQMFEKTLALQEPWRAAGVNALTEQQRLLGLGAAGKGTAGYGSLAKPFGMETFQADPGYAFRLAEGQKALERSAAARGGLLSGATLRGTEELGQNLASQEYQNAFRRYQIEREARLDPLQSLAGQGQTSAARLGAAGQDYATTAGGLGMDLATINAAKGIYGANIQNQMLNQLMGRVSTYI